MIGEAVVPIWFPLVPLVIPIKLDVPTPMRLEVPEVTFPEISVVFPATILSFRMKVLVDSGFEIPVLLLANVELVTVSGPPGDETIPAPVFPLNVEADTVTAVG